MFRMAFSPAAATMPPGPASLLRVLTRRETSLARWALALMIWLSALALQWLLDELAQTGPFLTFLPAVALATAVCGRWPALTVIGLSAVVCDYFWLPPAGFSMQWPTTPVSLALFVAIALFELVLVDALYLASRGNVEQRGRAESSLRLRQTMFEEMRHRVTDQLQVVTAMLEGSQIRAESGARIDDVLDQAIGRIASITYLQGLVDDKTAYQRGLVPLLRDMLDYIFYDVDVAVQVRAGSVQLSNEQTTIVCLIVIEAAMNSLNHIFRRRRGHMFAVELRLLDDGRLALTAWDDGPGFEPDRVMARSSGVGLTIIRGLASELGGQLHLESRGGTTLTVEFSVAT